MKINKEQKDYIIKLLQEGKEIPEDFKYLIFPTNQKEYELAYAGKMRKEDILAGEDGVDAVPLQVEKVFNCDEYESFDDAWKNMIVFGDNLQFLKTIYKNEDPLIKDKIKGKVKLIYIDPPFATTDEFRNKKGAKAYNDKKKGAEFVEFLRRRLVVAREILSEDGYIAVHLDQKMNSHIRLILDEIFEKNNFVNELIWRYFMGGKSENFFSKKHDTIYIYKKSGKSDLKIPNRERILDYKPNLIDDNSIIKKFHGIYEEKKEERDFYTSIVKQDDVFEISGVFNMGNEYISYPTQKPEELLKRIIMASSNEGDIVLDFFGGSGSTMAVAEKLGRRWITCDLGKLSYFTMQKRILQIEESKDLESSKSKYNKKAKSFITASLGCYDLEKVLNQEKDKYYNFVSELFDFKLKDNKVNGYTFEGKKGEYCVKIWNQNDKSNVDEEYLLDLHNNIKDKISKKVFIVAPINKFELIEELKEIDGIKYYFLKIPYQAINELHNSEFKHIRQPQSKKRVNDVENIVGFHFNREPKVVSKIKKEKESIIINIEKFISRYDKDEYSKQKLENFQTLSSVFIDNNYNGKYFIMTNSFFAEDLIKKIKSKDIRKELVDEDNQDIEVEDDSEEVKENLKTIKKLEPIIINKNKTSKQIMIIYVDIYGNEAKEIIKI